MMAECNVRKNLSFNPRIWLNYARVSVLYRWRDVFLMEETYAQVFRRSDEEVG